MRFTLLTQLLFAAATTSVAHRLNPQYGYDKLVKTSSGRVRGKHSGLRPGVSEYLGIPFAKPPLGNLRFSPPELADESKDIIDATAFSPDCPAARIPLDQVSFAGRAGSELFSAFAQAGTKLSEDCLTINIWTKPLQPRSKPKAVLFWVYSGGFSIGNSANPIYNGAVLAEEEDVVVVSFNYRLNAFGFAVAPGLTPNVGLLDQRLALEWTRDNIAAFGGDPKRITIFGESAGGFSVDALTFAYPSDPIAHALISESGSLDTISPFPPEQIEISWFALTKQLHCGTDDTATLRCMRGKKWEEIIQGLVDLGHAGLNSSFFPVADNATAPGDHDERGAAGDFAKIPLLVGSNDDEASFFLILFLLSTDLKKHPPKVPASLIQPLQDVSTFAAFGCPQKQVALYRKENGVPTWLYRYYASSKYTNTRWDYVNSSAYHTAELPTVFGTAEFVTGIPDNEIEAQAARYIRHAWAEFAKDPNKGLTRLGWPMFDPATHSQVRLAYQDEVSASFGSNKEFNELCPIITSIPNVQGVIGDFLLAFIGYAEGGDLAPGPQNVNKVLLAALEDISQEGLSRKAALKAFIKVLQKTLQ